MAFSNSARCSSGSENSADHAGEFFASDDRSISMPVTCNLIPDSLNDPSIDSMLSCTGEKPHGHQVLRGPLMYTLENDVSIATVAMSR